MFYLLFLSGQNMMVSIRLNTFVNKIEITTTDAIKTRMLLSHLVRAGVSVSKECQLALEMILAKIIEISTDITAKKNKVNNWRPSSTPANAILGIRESAAPKAARSADLFI